LMDDALLLTENRLVDASDGLSEIWWYLATAQADLKQTSKALTSAELALKLAKASDQPILIEKIEGLIKRLRSDGQ
jgi:hypothetical protein